MMSSNGSGLDRSHQLPPGTFAELKVGTFDVMASRAFVLAVAAGQLVLFVIAHLVLS